MNSFAYPYLINYAKISKGLELAYLDQGRGEYTLLFIHGLGSYLRAWQKNVTELKKEYRCVALDLPGYGKSRAGNFNFSMTFFARTIDAFIQKLGLQNVVLVGHSMGGQIAMIATLDLQTQIKKLVLIAPAGFETFTDPEKQWLRQVYTPALIHSATPEQIRQNFNLNFATNRLPSDAEFMYEDRMRMREDGDYYFRYSHMIPQCVDAMLREVVFHRLYQITVPTLILFGQEDLLIPNRILHPTELPLTIAQKAHIRIPNSELHLLSPCGHFAQWECARTVNERIKAFVG